MYIASIELKTKWQDEKDKKNFDQVLFISFYQPLTYIKLKLIIMETIEKELEYVGGFFQDLCPEANRIDSEGNLFKARYVTAEGYVYDQVGKVPFLPTIITTSTAVHGMWFEVAELTAEENEELALSFCHYEGTYYKAYWNRNSKFNWIAWFFCNYCTKLD